jgi:hypothetical protein
VKSPDFAPLSRLFPTFSVLEMIERLARLLCVIFAKHPILESVIRSLAQFAPKVSKFLPSLLTEDSDMSDSFFASLKCIAANKAVMTLQVFIDHAVRNPLAAETAAPRIEKISVKSPPSTFSFLLPDGTDALGPYAFSDWIRSVGRPGRGSFRQGKGREGLFGLLGDRGRLIEAMPAEPELGHFGLYYPALQVANIAGEVTKGCAFPTLIRAERAAHAAISANPSQQTVMEDAVLDFLGMVKFEAIEIAIPERFGRKQPMPRGDVITRANLVTMLAVADIQFILSGRSPLTCQRFLPNFTVDLAHPLMEEGAIAAQLMRFYTQAPLSPYIALRVAFAAGLALSESRPGDACSLVFEAIFLVNSVFPLLAAAPVVRAAVLFLAELLEKMDSYYYTAQTIDRFFTMDTTDFASASAIAQLASHNRDMVRAVFQYTELIKCLIRQNVCDQVLYLGKTVATIYRENGLNTTSIALLAHLLARTYGAQMVEWSGEGEGEAESGFRPEPTSVNTALVALYTVERLISARMHTKAEQLLAAVNTALPSSVLGKIITFLRGDRIESGVSLRGRYCLQVSCSCEVSVCV